MRKLSIILLTLLLPLLAAAGPVTEQQALLKAQQFMQGKTFTAQKSRRLAPGQDSNTAALYVFNAQEGGYAVVSGDDRTPAILGYSQEGRLDMDVLPEHIQSWLDGYAEQIAYLQEHPDAQVAAKTLGNAPSVAPLLGETEWDQVTPYNNLCPLYNGNRCVTGCVATAMAQIMYYHKWPEQTTNEIPGYTTSSKGINVNAIPAGTTIDWDNMLPKYYSNTGTDAQRQAVAQLMLLCGTTVKMDYASDASGAQTDNVAKALRRYFDYDGTVKTVDRLSYRLAEWNQLIYDEMAAGRPVEYAGSPVLPSALFSPHAFVIDGYDKDDFFHVNWGWGGTFNGFFLLSVLDYENQTQTDPFSNNYEAYTLNQLAVIGIQKNMGTVIVPELTTTKVSVNELGTQLTRKTAENNFQVSTNITFVNETEETGTFETCVGLFDSNDELLSLATSIRKETIDAHLSEWHVYNTVFGAGLPNGSYTLKAIHRLVGTTEWIVNHGSDRYYLIVNINNNNLELKNAGDIAVEMNVELAGEIKVGSVLSVAATIKNKGITSYNNELFVLVDNRCYIGGIIELNAGESKTLNFSFTPTEPGEKTISLNTRTYRGDYKWNYQPICSSTTVVVPVPDEYCLKSTMKAEQEQNGVVTDYNLKLNVHVNNLGRGTYDGKIKIEERNSHKEIIQPIIINGEQEIELQFVFDELDDGACRFSLYYWEDEEWKYSSVSLLLTYKRGETIAKSYAIYDNGTLTLYYDKNSDSRQGVVYDMSDYQPWRNVRDLITKVVFDPSFAEACPNSTRYWFYGCTTLAVIDGISYLNTSEVTNMDYMFYNCSGLTSLNVSGFNTANVTDMSSMFDGCSGLTSLDVSSFNTGNVTDMRYMFNGCSGLTSLDVSNFNTSNVTDMSGMFDGCSGLTSLDVSSFNTGNVTDMRYMFNGCSGLTSLDVGNFNTAKVTVMERMFYGCKGLAVIDVSKFNTQNVTTMSQMFMSCSGLLNLDVSKFNTQNVNNMGSMFYGCSSLTSLDVSNFNTQNVTYMSQMFMDCSSLLNLDVSGFKTENVTSMSMLFSGCSGLTSLDLNNFNTAKVSYMKHMFDGCSSLQNLTLGHTFISKRDTHVDDMFANCLSLGIIQYTGDIPSSINSQFFAGVGTAAAPATLDVPAEYRDHYAAKFDDNKFFGGYFKLSGGEEPDSYITFACPVAEAICLENWDTNGDGKLSKAEAAAVTSLNGKFYNSAITSFAELQYFEGLTALEDNAFTMCKQLTTLTIPKNVARIGESVFSGCSRLTKLEVDAASPYFCVDNDVLYTKDRRELIVCLLHKSGKLTVDQRCKVIADNAFYNCSQLTAIVLPDGLETIKAGVFVGCTSLGSLHIPAKVTAIGMGGFTGCTLLNSITVDAANTVFSSDNGVLYNKSTSTLMAYPNRAGRKYSVVDGTRVIDPYAFCMTQIEEIELPATVILFGRNAFTYCSGLAKVTAHAEQPVAISDDVFSESTYATATLYVPNGTKTLYQQADGWKNFQYIVELGGDEPAPQPLLSVNVEYANTIDDVAYSDHLELSWQWRNISDEPFDGQVHYEPFRLENGEWVSVGWTDRDALTLDAGKYGTPFSISQTLADGQYKIEWWYSRKDTDERVVAKTTYAEVNSKSDKWAIVMKRDGMMTYCDKEDLSFASVEGLKAYTAGGFNTATSEALMMRVTDAPAETGLLLVGKKGLYLVRRATSPTVYVNMLKGVLNTQQLSPSDGYYDNYYFDPYKQVFKAAISGSTFVTSNSAYLQIPTQAAGSRQTITLKFDDTSGIGEVSSAEGEPFDVYTVSGQVVRRGVTSLKGLPAGIYIAGGRKVVVR